MSTWIAVRDAIPWLPMSPYLVELGDVPLLRESLRENGFNVFEADATSVTDERGLLNSLGDALGFPDFYGANWAAFEDCVSDLVREGVGATAVIVVGADTLRDSDLPAFVRSVHNVQDVVAEVERADSDAFQLEVFFAGDWSARRVPPNAAD